MTIYDNVDSWQSSTSIGLSQTEEDGPHEVTKMQYFSLGFQGTFSTWGGRFLRVSDMKL